MPIRPARPEDEDDLRRIDRATWTPLSSPAPRPPGSTPFFDERSDLADVLVAEADGAVAGYVRLGPATTLAASERVLLVRGIAVDPALQGRGIGRALVEAAVDEARRRGARRLTLHVLGHNEAARRLYAACGFEIEGVLHGEFELDGRPVDDVVMARDLAGGGSRAPRLAHVFAGLAVRDYEAARAWYERLLGRPPDLLPKDGEAVWSCTAGGSVYVVVDPDRAGGGLAAVAVDGLDRLRERLVAEGIASADGAGRRLAVEDPDGNAILFFQHP